MTSLADTFPTSLPEFQRLFPDDAACARYLEGDPLARRLPVPGVRRHAEPFRFANRPGVLRCRAASATPR